MAASNAKLALFYDWLFYDAEKGIQHSHNVFRLLCFAVNENIFLQLLFEFRFSLIIMASCIFVALLLSNILYVDVLTKLTAKEKHLQYFSFLFFSLHLLLIKEMSIFSNFIQMMKQKKIHTSGN